MMIRSARCSIELGLLSGCCCNCSSTFANI